MVAGANVHDTKLPLPTGIRPTYDVLVRRSWDSFGEKTHPARRWVVERTLSWLSKCRGLLVRYDKKASNFLGLLQLACGLLRYRRVWRLTVLR